MVFDVPVTHLAWKTTEATMHTNMTLKIGWSSCMMPSIVRTNMPDTAFTVMTVTEPVRQSKAELKYRANCLGAY